MPDVLQRVFSDLGKGVLYDSPDPLYLGAMGAARAKWRIRNLCQDARLYLNAKRYSR